MKKQFFYAAMALAMLSSCSKDNDPAVVPNPDNNNANPAIELGINAPSVSVNTRASGTVGGMTDETNLWEGQTLHVVAYDKGTTTKTTNSESTTDPKEYIFNNLTFKAPTQTWNPDAAEGSKLEGGKSIYILKDASTIQAVYYNPTGNMDFYGYHIDDLTGATLDDATKTVSGITITGAEDLLGAKTKEVNAANYPSVNTDDIAAFNAPDPERGFSAWAARRGIQPILEFKHLLTRLTFTVTAAKADAAKYYWDATANGGTGEWTENKSKEAEAGNQSSTAVEVTSITIKDVKTGMQIVLDGTEAGKTYPYAVATADAIAPEAGLSLQERNAATGTIQALTATAPVAFDASDTDHSASFPEADGIPAYSTKTPVGESLMIPEGATELQLEIKLQQKVIDTESYPNKDNPTYKTKTGLVKYTLPYTAVQNGVAEQTAFTAGYSYNVNIKVFSFERIDITAELAKWVSGGDFDIDAE